ncbi:hypothetical protein LIER_40095 [Lithospermum erythrorhizon]|uniref:Uncharacterized protein n=1 Tax=Lithospermum erythrorhizon TaxID=34254 RepID=A0AAV3QQJ3_LITER
MSILCWNCRAWFSLLIETKLRKEDWDQIKLKLRLPNALVVDAKDRKGDWLCFGQDQLRWKLRPSRPIILKL